MRSLALVALLPLFASCSMIKSLSGPAATAEVFAGPASNARVAVEAAFARGESVAAMLLPEFSRQASNMIILKGVARTKLDVINGADSFDAQKIQRYKDQVGGGRFDIAPEDAVKFTGVRYIIVYSQFSEPASDGPFVNRGQATGYFNNKIEMKFWDVATGQLVATCEASGTYGSQNKFEGMDDAIANALRSAGLPGVQ